MRRSAVLAATAGLLALAPGASAYTSDLPTSQNNPMANKPWFVDWEWGLAQRQYLDYAAGRPIRAADYELRRELAAQAQADPLSLIPRMSPERQSKAPLILKIARNPQTMRYGTWTKRPRQEVRWYLRRLRRTQPGAYAFFYIYRLSHKGCVQRKSWQGYHDPDFAGETPREAKRYRRWIRLFAAGLGHQPAAIFLEPDSLGVMECLPKSARTRRYGLLRYAIRALSRNPNATIYLDAGASDWIKPRIMVRRLKIAGVGATRGFFLNSTHYDWTSNNLRYGDRLSRALGGKHYVVSTAVNGRGPYRLPRKKRYFNELRCNPPGRALGEEPTVRTGSVWADAYLWIGDPGKSGSAKCPHPGMPKAPPAGRWWEWYALDLAARTPWP